MNKLLIAALAVMIAVPASLSAKSFTRALTVNGSFNTLKTDGNIEVEYTPASRFSATIKAEYKEDLDKVKASIGGGKLTITTVGNQRGDIKVKLSAPAVSNFEAGGNSEIEVEGNVSGSTVSLKSDNNASIEIELNVNAPKLAIESRGNSHIEIEGTAMSTQIKVDADLNSHIKISALNSDALQVDADGNSHFTCRDITTGNLTVATGNNAHASLGGHAGIVSYAASGNSSIKAGMLSAKGGKAESKDNAHITAAVRGLQQSSTGNSYINNK